MGAVDPLRALEARPVRVEDSRCGICNAPARWWTDGWLECQTCGIYDPKDYAETAQLERLEDDRRRRREDQDG